MAIVNLFGGERKHFFDGSQEIPGVWILPRRCPCCGGDLVKHGKYPRQESTDGVWIQWIWIPRMRCKRCGRTQAVLPHFLAPYQRILTHLRAQTVAAWTAGKAYGVWLSGWASVYVRSGVGCSGPSTRHRFWGRL